MFTADELIELLESIPEAMRERKIQVFNTSTGEKMSLRKDVSQLVASGEFIQLLVDNR